MNTIENVTEKRQRGDLATGKWRSDLPLPRCRGCGEEIPTMFAIPSHVQHEPFEIVYPEMDARKEP